MLIYVFNFFKRFINTKVPYKGAVIKIGVYKTVKNNFKLLSAHVLLQSEYLVCILVLYLVVWMLCTYFWNMVIK